ncbi:Uncharacterized protein HZ326_13705 [Fusarium oxysporum f. sp. albedinis]|nr:Uncharacterized protein HZ326_13705 [Fusarium oxysporum f. sp. albedinis]
MRIEYFRLTQAPRETLDPNPFATHQLTYAVVSDGECKASELTNRRIRVLRNPRTFTITEIRMSIVVTDQKQHGIGDPWCFALHISTRLEILFRNRDLRMERAFCDRNAEIRDLGMYEMEACKSMLTRDLCFEVSNWWRGKSLPVYPQFHFSPSVTAERLGHFDRSEVCYQLRRSTTAGARKWHALR